MTRADRVSTVVAMVGPNEKNTADATEPMLRCPYCRYDLTGLPGPHRCPECAFEYGAEAKSWESPYFGTRMAVRIAFVQLVRLAGALIGAKLAGSMFLTAGVSQQLLYSMLFALWVMTTIYVVFIHFGARRIVYCDKQKLVFGGRRSRMRSYLWSELWIPHPSQRITIPPWVGTVEERRTGSFQRLLLAGFLGMISFDLPKYVFVRPKGKLRGLGLNLMFWPIDYPRNTKKSILGAVYSSWSAAEANPKMVDSAIGVSKI